MEQKVVYIVHCIDTEGPLYESLEETFKRVKEIFGFFLEPTKDNLHKLQNKSIDLSGKEEAVANLVKPSRIKMNETWDQIDKMLEEIMNENFRKLLPDSKGNGWIYNWFCMDHVGFTGYNPRRRDAGYHNIYDHYLAILKRRNETRDDIQWHYHPLPFSGDYNYNATAYVSSKNIFEILARKIIDRLWFPAAFRPGFHAERPDSNWFLEQWIPFDYANQAVEYEKRDQPDIQNGRHGDWRRAPKEWIIYHPSHDNYQVAGSCRRWIARCLNMEARFREISIEDFRKGFSRAQQGKPTVISFTNHDFRDMKVEILKMMDMIKIVSAEFPDVKFIYSNAVDAMRKVLDLKPIKSDFQIQLIKQRADNSAIFQIECKNSIFGPQPFLAIKTVTGEYYWDNLDFLGTNHWSYTFDKATFPVSAIDKVGIAANSPEGVTEVVVYDVVNDKINRKLLND